MASTTGTRQRHKTTCTARERQAQGKPAKCACPWEYNLELPAALDGTRRQVSKSGFASQKAAKDARAEQERIYRDQDMDIAASRMTVAEWLEKWLEGRTDPHGDNPLAITTASSYRQHIDSHLRDTVGRVRLRDLKPMDIQRLRRDLRAKGLAEGTVTRVCATLGSALTDAMVEGYILTSPVPRAGRQKKSKKAKESAPKVNPWTPAEWQKFQTAVKDDRLYPLYLLAADAGMRRGELCGLRWSDVDLEEGCLTVSRALVHVGNQVIETTPKSDAGQDRTVYLADDTITALRAWKKAQAKEQISDRVFTQKDGSDLVPKSLYQAFTRKALALDLRVIRFHDLRHLSASLGAAGGESPLAVSRRLGHADPAFTMRTYQHVWDDQAKEAAKSRGRFLTSEAAGE